MASALSLKQLSGWWGKPDRVEAVATTPATPREHSVVSGPFMLDLRLHHATLAGEELHLDEDEFEMLLFLIRHRTNIITPRTRLTTRWSRTQSRHSDFLQTLANLQRKLESVPGGHNCIRTESWIVCRFDPGKEEQR